MARTVPLVVLRLHAFIRRHNRYPTPAEVRKLADFAEAGGIARLCEAVAYLGAVRDGPKVKPTGPVEPELMREAMHAAAEQHGIPAHQLLGPGRDRKTAHARQDAYARCKALGASSTYTGEFFACDHTTVLHGVRAHAERMAAE